ncbi:MAG: hypothetical protein KDK99_18650 [Verrucomicrobiales bacterium]|nr:hypothetical protein [Verrucomicrobiales bacterium]
MLAVLPTLLAPAEWQARNTVHRQRVERAVVDWQQRRSRALKHPVEDFLFTYYTFSPTRLLQWSPSWAEAVDVSNEQPEDHLHWTKPPFSWQDDQLRLDTRSLPTKTRHLARWISHLCASMLERPPVFRCFGLHEWAMVYRQSAEEIRHQGQPLRLPAEELAAFVESQTLCCTHYDAFRFFTPEAQPRNAHQPTLDSRPDLEQGGCIHANMDLYKWSSKLWPWIGSDLVGQCFELALQARTIDMRASPYDLAHLGYDPIPIETVTGRLSYEAEQRQLAAAARPLREALQKAAEALVQLPEPLAGQKAS